MGRPIDKNRVLNSQGLIVLIVYISLALSVALPFQCIPNPNGTTSMASNPGVICWESELHTQMAALAAANRTDADVEALQGCLAEVEAAQEDAQRYSDAITALSLAVASATGNRIFPMLVHWHARVQTDLQELLLVVRQPSRAHFQGIAFLVGLIIARDSDAITDLLGHFHGMRLAAQNQDQGATGAADIHWLIVLV